MRTVQGTLAKFSATISPQLFAPVYSGTGVGSRLGLAVESMSRHMTDEGWQLFQGLEEAGYQLRGDGLPVSTTDVTKILDEGDAAVIVIQDKREWEGLTADRSRDPSMRFTNVQALRERPDIFKVTVLKDAQHNPEYHREAAKEIGCHAWIIYYHPLIVSALAPYVRPEHLVRTYHSVDAKLIPPFHVNGRLSQALVSGALSGAYPLRSSICKACLAGRMDHVFYLKHPGYHRQGSATPEYLKTLSQYKVAICTSSRYGYALRKIIEATAAGCIVVTDLPEDEILPEIENNLFRIPSDSSPEFVDTLARGLCDKYTPALQEVFANRAKTYYDYRYLGKKLADDIETLRRNY